MFSRGKQDKIRLLHNDTLLYYYVYTSLSLYNFIIFIFFFMRKHKPTLNVLFIKIQSKYILRSDGLLAARPKAYKRIPRRKKKLKYTPE